MKKEKYTLRKNNCNNCNCNARLVLLPLKGRKTIGYNPVVSQRVSVAGLNRGKEGPKSCSIRPQKRAKSPCSDGRPLSLRTNRLFGFSEYYAKSA